MKTLTFLLISITFFSCYSKRPSNKEVITNHPYLIGHWSGTGKFLDPDYNQLMGPQPIHIWITPNDISIEINGILTTQTHLYPTKYGFEIRGFLSTELNYAPTGEKNKIVLFLVLPQNNRSTAQDIDVNFHLKSNFNFDYTMKVGGVKLRKTK
ncbi:MAG: hypothetical protein ACI9GM_000317 [Salibacteraceae bacterium]|jgi:hypothetical protein